MTTKPGVPDISLQGLELNSNILLLDNHNYWDLYPTEEPLALQKIERTSTGIGLVLTLATAFEFDHLEITGEGHAIVNTEGAIITVRFPNEQAMEPQLHNLTIIAVSNSGERTASYYLGLHFASKARDAANGRTMSDRVIIRDTDLKLIFSRVGDWIIEHPTVEDCTYAKNRWGSLTDNLAGAYAKARALTRSIIDDFEPRRGTPSDAMSRLHPFRQHERILTGIDRGWCANMAEVLCHGLNSLDIPARLVRMRNTYYNATSETPGENFEVLLAGGHTIVEIYDADLKQWIWIDPSQRQLGARDAGGHLLNLAEIQQRVNLPHQAADLRFEQYDPTTQTKTIYAFADSPIRPNLMNFAKREQRFYYFKRL